MKPTHQGMLDCAYVKSRLIPSMHFVPYFGRRANSFVYKAAVSKKPFHLHVPETGRYNKTFGLFALVFYVLVVEGEAISHCNHNVEVPLLCLSDVRFTGHQYHYLFIRFCSRRYLNVWLKQR